MADVEKEEKWADFLSNLAAMEDPWGASVWEGVFDPARFVTAIDAVWPTKAPSLAEKQLFYPAVLLSRLVSNAKKSRDATASDQISQTGELSAHWISSHLPSGEIQRIMEVALSVFEDAAIAKEWLLEPNLATDNKPPIDLLGSAEGYARG